MKNCFLHIGHAKTATSSLQNFMHVYEDLFASRDIWVPGDYRALKSHNCKAIAQAGGTFAGNFGPIFNAHAAKNMELYNTLLDHVLSRDADVLLSTELIFYYKHMVRDVVRAANERGYAVTLIAYLRRQDRMVVPTYYQNIRNHGYHKDLLTFLAETADVRYFRYHEVMSVYAVSAPNRIIVRTFEPEFLTGGDIIEDFTSLLGVELPEHVAARPRERVNPSLPLETLEILRALNAAGRPDVVKQVLAQPNDAPSGSKRAWKYYYNAKVAATVKAQFMTDNAALLSDFMPECSEAERAYWMQSPDRPEPAPQLDTRALATALAAFLPARS